MTYIVLLMLFVVFVSSLKFERKDFEYTVRFGNMLPFYVVSGAVLILALIHQAQ